MSDAPRPTPATYASAGVDIDAGNQLVKAIAPLVRSTARSGADAAIGGFGGVFDLKAAGYRDPLLVAANDGVGTKLKIAIEAGIHDTVGIDLVAMCVNDLIVQGAEPLFFLDYFATGKLNVAAATEVIAGIVAGCRESGCALIGGETAEMPGIYQGGDYDLAGFAVGAVERDRLLPRPDAKAGDVLLALGSTGVHSNGFSLVRKLVYGSRLGWSVPAPFAPEVTLGRALLTPTRLYVRSVLGVLKDGLPVKALAHITGGGLTENLPRVLPDDVSAAIDLSSITVPPVFRWLAGLGRMEEAEMLRTFNCGVGMIVVVPEEAVDAVAARFGEFGETVCRIGTLVPAGAERVLYSGALDLAWSA